MQSAAGETVSTKCDEQASEAEEGPLSGVKALGKQAAEKSKEWGPAKTAAIFLVGGLGLAAVAGKYPVHLLQSLP